MPEPIDQIRLNALLAAGWKLAEVREAIEKEFKFKGFRRAFGFMAASAAKADAINHHPEWFNVYNRVRVLLTTHDTGGLTELDADLAEAMDAIAAEIAAGGRAGRCQHGTREWPGGVQRPRRFVRRRGPAERGTDWHLVLAQFELRGFPAKSVECARGQLQ